MSNVLKFSLRMPEDIHTEIKKLADQDDRSLNNYIVKVLENHIKSTQGASRDTNRKLGE